MDRKTDLVRWLLLAYVDHPVADVVTWDALVRRAVQYGRRHDATAAEFDALAEVTVRDLLVGKPS
jgi:hypothetical protein